MHGLSYLIHATICKHIHVVKVSSSTLMSNTEDCTENVDVIRSEDTCMSPNEMASNVPDDVPSTEF